MDNLNKWGAKIQEIKTLENDRLKRENDRKLMEEAQTREKKRLQEELQREKEKVERDRRNPSYWKSIMYRFLTFTILNCCIIISISKYYRYLIPECQHLFKRNISMNILWRT